MKSVNQILNTTLKQRETLEIYEGFMRVLALGCVFSHAATQLWKETGNERAAKRSLHYSTGNLCLC